MESVAFAAGVLVTLAGLYIYKRVQASKSSKRVKLPPDPRPMPKDYVSPDERVK